ncbi:sodium- and chloride-dependent glycine transporter 2 [Caerostris darwini]|uniref:Transporter n=1 Tax=Caerostris darwini TaxID=1538125 RepID=A0AAV4RIN9_9ARAC|nr:sodium- and chloride-dependent glycine transporter 2 [Caerostris darwini]
MAELEQCLQSKVPDSSDRDKRLLPHLDSSLPLSIHENDENKRSTWSKQLDFFLSCIGYAVGLGNIWRFPYLCYKSGGGAFLIPYIIFLVICGIPLFFLEMSLGQFGSLGPIAIWKISPIFKGVGFGMAIVSAVVCVYYNVIIAWALYYIYQSYSVSWSSCENSWNTPNCISQDIYNVSSSINLSKVSNFSALHNSSNSSKMTSSEEFWLYKVLRQSDSIEDVGSFQWPLVLTLIIAWILVFFCVMRGIKTSGKVVYITATFPYCVLLCLLVRGLTLPGAWNGISFYLYPQWEKLLTFKVWGDAATQIFYSVGAAWGALLTMASYNKFNNNVYRDSLVVPIINCATSVLAGFVVFSLLGFMAYETGKSIEDVVSEDAEILYHRETRGSIRNRNMPARYNDYIMYSAMENYNPVKSPGIGRDNQLYNFQESKLFSKQKYLVAIDPMMYFSSGMHPDIAVVVNKLYYKELGEITFTERSAVKTDRKGLMECGPGLAFVVYPEAISRLPVSPAWAFLFFFMLFAVGLDTQFGMFETTVSAFVDEYPNFLQKRKTLFAAFLCVLMFVLGLPCVTQGGFYVVQLMDWYCAAFSLMVISLLETIAVSWIYGVDRFLHDISLMTNKVPSMWWKLCWCYITPFTIIALLIFILVNHTAITYNDYVYPSWSIAIGWIIALCSIAPIPIVAAWVLYKEEGDFKQKLIKSLRPDLDWGPALAEHRILYRKSINIVPNRFEQKFVENVTISTNSSVVKNCSEALPLEIESTL